MPSNAFPTSPPGAASTNGSPVNKAHAPLASGPNPTSLPSRMPQTVEKDVQFISYDEHGYTVKGLMALPGVDMCLVLEILNDHEARPRVFKNVVKCNVVETLPSGEQNVKQTCRWQFKFLSGKFDCLLHFQEQNDTPTQGDWHADFDLIKSSFMNNFHGHWHVHPVPVTNAVPSNTTTAIPGNAPATVGCYVEHLLQVKPALPVPKPIAKLANGIFVSQVHQLFDDLEAEINRIMAEQHGQNAHTPGASSAHANITPQAMAHA